MAANSLGLENNQIGKLNAGGAKKRPSFSCNLVALDPFFVICLTLFNSIVEAVASNASRHDALRSRWEGLGVRLLKSEVGGALEQSASRPGGGRGLDVSRSGKGVGLEAQCPKAVKEGEELGYLGHDALSSEWGILRARLPKAWVGGSGRGALRPWGGRDTTPRGSGGGPSGYEELRPSGGALRAQQIENP
ncbi:hypothetical protein H5410_016006 [Solanum commersonii]|uniref:Uncharacterized protein n=1 Tax=Solanum commersonii TaxID=4109 RepID=A0A9J5ZV94_SOLCO|nr:hypothetical protein H5410_016006 [Solanum commersonii]